MKIYSYRSLIGIFLGVLLLGCSSIHVINAGDLSTDSSVSESSKNTEKRRTAFRKIASSTTFETETKNLPVLEGWKRDNPKHFKLNYSKKLFDFWVHYYTKRDSERFIRHLENADKFYPVVNKIFKEEGLPTELFFVGLIESGYNTAIRSRASAVGPWQFIKGTAKRYDLKVDWQFDERRNIHKATRAAAKYFKDLYNIFGNWELALCAYNAGEYRILRAVKKGNTRDYKQLVRKRLLPRETIYYIPKIAAAKFLYDAKNRENHKLGTQVPGDELYTQSEVVKINKSFDLSNLSKNLDIPYQSLKILNPGLKFNHTKVYGKAHHLVLPSRKIGAISKSAYVTSQVRAPAILSYKVRRGDNLIGISEKYGTSVLDIQTLNKMSDAKIYVGQNLKVFGPYNHNVTISMSDKNTRLYKVKSGDNLYSIAKRFKTTISEIVALNDLEKRTIYPSQRLKLPL